MNLDYINTYWNSKGKYQEHVVFLQALVPLMGEVQDAEDNPALELFRCASNAYYDLYNNGLGNRNRDFREIFTDYPYCLEDDEMVDLDQPIVDTTEHTMDGIVLAAFNEQKGKL